MTEGSEATSRGPATPPVKFSFGYLALGVSVNGLESLTQTHRTAKFGVLTTEIFALLLTSLTAVPDVAAQAAHCPFEIGSLALKLVAHLIECCAGQYHDVELVEDDPGTRKIFRSSLHIGRAHIHGNRLDLGGIATVLEQRRGKGVYGLSAPSLDHEEQTRVLGIQYIGHVAVPASGTGLIDGNPPQGAPAALTVFLLPIVHHHSPHPAILLINQIVHPTT